jgi:hypothetical protein
MRCCSPGSIREYLDGELSRRDHWAVETHLSACPECRALRDAIADDERYSSTALSALASRHSSVEPDIDGAWRALVDRIEDGNGPYGLGRFRTMDSRFRKIAIVGGSAVILTGALAMSPIRSVASDILSVFRVNKIDTINISLADMSKIRTAMERSGDVSIRNFGAISTEGERTTRLVSVDEATKGVGFQVMVPKGIGDPSILLSSASSITVTPKVASVNEFLKSLGGTKMLPADLGNKSFTLEIPASVSVNSTTADGKRVSIYESHGPQITAPSGVDVNEIRDALLDLPIVPDDIKNQIRGVNDWQHTVLIPNIEGSSEKVSIGGIEGVFVTPTVNKGGHGAYGGRGGSEQMDSDSKLLVWQNDGVIFGIAGDFTKDEAISIASTMR